MQRNTVTRRILALSVGFATALTPVVALAPAAAADAGTPITVSGVLHAGTPAQVVYEAIKPADWNGTLVLDLDFNGWNTNQRTWFLDQGYAIGGNQRTQNETAYEIKDYVDNLVETRRLLTEAIAASGEPLSEPSRTIAFGASRGAFVARMAPEYRSDIFDGAIAFAGGGSGVLAAWLGKADAVWTLKTLVDPNAPLAINNLPDIAPGASYGPSYQQDVALGALVTEARSSDAGMARLILAAAFSQSTEWPTGAVRPAADDYLTQGNLIAGSFAFGHPQFVHKEIEVMAGGPIVWNHGIDYAQLLETSGALDRVSWWYEKAGLDLDADLKTLSKTGRYSADPDAVAVVEQTATYTGQTDGAPVFSLKTIGDSADAVALDQAYERTFAAAGTSEYLRTAFINRSGHSSQSLMEKFIAFEVLIDRLDTGAWADTSPAALNARAADIAATSPVDASLLGTAVFIDFDPGTTLRPWDFTNWGSYDVPASCVPRSLPPQAGNGNGHGNGAGNGVGHGSPMVPHCSAHSG